MPSFNGRQTPKCNIDNHWVFGTEETIRTRSKARHGEGQDSCTKHVGSITYLIGNDESLKIWAVITTHVNRSVTVFDLLPSYTSVTLYITDFSIYNFAFYRSVNLPFPRLQKLSLFVKIHMLRCLQC